MSDQALTIRRPQPNLASPLLRAVAGRVAEAVLARARVTTLVATEVVKLAQRVAAPGAERIWALKVAPVWLAALPSGLVTVSVMEKSSPL